MLGTDLSLRCKVSSNSPIRDESAHFLYLPPGAPPIAPYKSDPTPHCFGARASDRLPAVVQTCRVAHHPGRWSTGNTEQCTIKVASMHRMFGTELRRRRLAAQLSLAELAKLVHYSRSYLSKIENGLKESNADLARRCDIALSANGALAALVPHTDPANPQPATAQTEADDIWMLTLANDGSNHFMPANRRAIPAMHVALGFDIPYGQISAAAPDEATVSVFQSLFHECVRLSEVVGTSAAIPTVIAQVHVLQSLASKAAGNSRMQLLVLAGRYAEYAGWLAQEGGDDRAAIWWTNLSASIAARAGSVDLAAFLCARLSEIVLYEDATRSVTLARQA